MRKILIVEDVDVNIDLLQQMLEGDYALVVAKNGAAAIEMASTEKPDLILMDVSLPIVNGLDATRLVRSNQTLCHIPVIAVTAHAMEGDKARALDAGCDDYVSKPIDEDQLMEKIRGLIRNGRNCRT
jgi:two-component system, cell cycle response regulator DivK